MKTFEDILRVRGAILRDAIPMIDAAWTALALKTATPKLKAMFFTNMSEVDAAKLRELMEFMGPVRLADVEEAQHQVSAVVFTLEAERDDDDNAGTAEGEA